MAIVFLGSCRGITVRDLSDPLLMLRSNFQVKLQLQPDNVPSDVKRSLGAMLGTFHIGRTMDICTLSKLYF